MIPPTGVGMDFMSTSLQRRSSLSSSMNSHTSNSMFMGGGPQQQQQQHPQLPFNNNNNKFPLTAAMQGGFPAGGMGMNVTSFVGGRGLNSINNISNAINDHEIISRLMFDAAKAKAANSANKKQRYCKEVSPPSTSPLLNVNSSANNKSLRQEEVEAAEALLFGMGRRSSDPSSTDVVEKRNDDETTTKKKKKYTTKASSSIKNLPKKKKQKNIKIKKSTFGVPTTKDASSSSGRDHHKPLKKRIKVE
jgi:hypothetical protein